ncbi:MAG: EAL domain-containing protein [Acidimicrobiia bacterium]|nr:EAL domain-containing protein [Acidimicrobiia bacterium]
MVKPSERTFQLPGAVPKLILLASADATIVKHLDEHLIAQADAVDIRSGAVWIEVSECRKYLHLLVERVSRPGDVKIAIADLDASPSELVGASLLAPTLSDVGQALDDEDRVNSEIEYQIRYQPVVRLADRGIVGYEALIRADLNGERLSAEDLITRAAKGGWLPEFDQLCRQHAIRGVGPWLGAGLLFLNIMAPDGTFDLAAARRTIRQAEDIGLDPDQLVLEATERNRYTDIDLAAAQLTKLRNAGVRIAIDDVGDGYSSLRVATSFKPDVLKLSGDLVDALPSDEATAIIRAVVDLAHETGAWVVAEGVETEAQAASLLRLEVDWGQGRLFGRPEQLPAG